MQSQTLGDALARLNVLHTDCADERLVTAIISAARDGIIAAYQRELDTDAATESVIEMARSLLTHINNIRVAIQRRGEE